MLAAASAKAPTSDCVGWESDSRSPGCRSFRCGVGMEKGAGIGPTARLIRKLRTVADLTPDAVEAVERLPMRLRDVAEGADILSQGDRPTDCCAIVEGWACRYEVLDRGQRQIFSFHI